MAQPKASAPPPPPPPPIGQPYPIETAFEPPGPINDLYRIAAVDFITLLSKFGMKVLSDYRVYGRDKISDATMRRAPGRPLLSVSNHRCVVDDPATLSAMLTWSEVHQINRMRWGLCAREVCFKKKFLEPFFHAVKVFPIERGAGVYQPSMQTLQLRFNAGEWVHIFPEGRVVQTEDLGPFKWGTGRMVADGAAASPLIIPFAFFGMEKTFPYRANGSLDRYKPHFGQRVRGLVGDAFDCSDLIARFNALRAANSDAAGGGWADQWPLAPEELHAAITRRVEIEMLKLYARLRAVTEAEAEAEARNQPFDGDAFLAALPPLRDDQVPNGAPMPLTNERRFVPDPCRGGESIASSSSSSSSSSLSPKQQPVLSLARYLHSRSSLNLFNSALIYPVAPPFHSLAVAVPAPDASSAAVEQRPWFFRDADATRCAFPLVGRLVAGLHWRGAAPDPFANAPSLPSSSSSSSTVAPSKASVASAASAVLASPPVQLARAWLRRWTEWRHGLRASSGKSNSDSIVATDAAKTIDRRAVCGGVQGFLAAVVRAVEPLPAST